VASETTFERVFRTALDMSAHRDWVRIVQGFLAWNPTHKFDEYLRLRSEGPNTGCICVRAWEVEGLRAKLTEPHPAPTHAWAATEGCRSTRLSRRFVDEAGSASVDFYLNSGLPPLATWTFADMNSAATFDPPPWTIDEITAEYRFISRGFAS
jgi:hypothetical protein